MATNAQVHLKQDVASDRRALENFAIGNRDLAELEARVSRFNFFEALGVVRSELRHSRFLAYLLSPKESHGLKDLFLKRFLQEALQAKPEVASATPIGLEVKDLASCDIKTETDNIDILIRFPVHRIAVIIENKIDTDQHDDQLARYFAAVSGRYHDWEVFGIYLTRYADDPLHQRYVAVSHAAVARLIREVISLPQVNVPADVEFALRQYTDMLGRHFMADESIKELCVKIYQQHKQAIDLIIEHLPDQRDTIVKALKALVLRDGLILDDDKVQTVRFVPPDLDLGYFRGSSWTRSGRMLLFEFVLAQNSLKLGLYIGPGEDAKRVRVFKTAQRLGTPFAPGNTMYAKWNTLYQTFLLEADDYNLDVPDLLARISERWGKFVSTDLEVIIRKLLDIKWEEGQIEPDGPQAETAVPLTSG